MNRNTFPSKVAIQILQVPGSPRELKLVPRVDSVTCPLLILVYFLIDFTKAPTLVAQETCPEDGHLL
jgi:hypothetical protein